MTGREPISECCTELPLSLVTESPQGYIGMLILKNIYVFLSRMDKSLQVETAPEKNGHMVALSQEK